MSYESSVERYVLEECEKGFTVHPVLGDCRLCPTGDAYVTFACHLKLEGEERSLYPNLSEARDAFLSAFREYSKGKEGGTLYWRWKPTVEFVDPVTNTWVREDGSTGTSTWKSGWGVWARLVIVANESKE